MIRKIISIDEELCNGCGLCVSACHEGALQMIDGKAKLVSESYCDGLGDCLPECPTGAITIEEREADAFDKEAVKRNMEKKNAECSSGGCISARPMTVKNEQKQDCSCNLNPKEIDKNGEKEDCSCNHGPIESQLRQWPIQIQLVPVNAPYFDGVHLLVAADCTAYAYANIHNDYMKNKITLIGCPKLDDADYSEKLAAILKRNDIKSVTVLRMSVPCCGGLSYAVKQALIKSGKMIPWRIVVIDTDGTILEES
ncbi:MAG TPA: ferredoxin [Clostridiales bacterium]|nr:ferredoxin [Clostridiales bacterium]